jgi:hypothetical protein
MPGVPLNEIVRRMRRGVSEGLDDVAAQFVDAGTRIIETEAVDTGDLKNNVYTRRPAWNRRTVAWASKHAVFVHFGTRPHWPPLAPILAWVRRNLARITLSDGSNQDVFKPGGRHVDKARRSPERVVQEVARAVQAKIARDGTAPVPWVPRAWAEVQPNADRLLSEALRRNLQ